MAREIYNFIWTMPPLRLDAVPAQNVQLPDKVRVSKQPFAVPLQSGATVDVPLATTRAVILFPALLTPLVHVDKHSGVWLELLIATEHPLTASMVNRQLKISAGLHPEKSYNPAPLFGGAGKLIVVTSIDVGLDKILKTDSTFSGILHPSFIKALEKQKLTNLYKIKLHQDCLPKGSPQSEEKCSRQERKFVAYQTGAKPEKIEWAVVGEELHDVMIRAMFDERFGAEGAKKPNSIAGRCRYAFQVKDNGTVDLINADPKQPIQSYHPLVVFSGDDAFSYANLGHVSDIHMNSRWQLLGETRARVVEWGDGKFLDDSPEIGKILAETNRSFYSVLHRMLASKAHAVIVGGDLIDHIRNAYSPARMLSGSNTVHQIWDAMDLDGSAYDQKRYPLGLDLVAFYSLIVDALAKHQKPMFGITGNHDCYVDAFGISPRLWDNRTNSGIPADLNLTFYEALLAFGPSAGMLTKMGSSFESKWFQWFHLVLTPFNDWWFKFPRQSLVGLGWGTEEDLLDFKGDQSLGHLPRSDDAITASQLALLKLAVEERKKRKVTLTSHFTFLSYREDVPMLPAGDDKPGSPGQFGLNAPEIVNTPPVAIPAVIPGFPLTPVPPMSLPFDKFSKFEMGTFMSNRAALLDMLGKRQIQCVLTGHSHRRGLHLLGDRAGQHIPARLYDTAPETGLSLAAPGMLPSEPAIIVSDSAGPYPRYNRYGEFMGVGSDKPGGTLVKFDPKDGGITNVKTIQAERKKPRAAVALDYHDVMNDGVLLGNGLSVRAVSSMEASGACGPLEAPLWYIDARLTPEMSKLRKIRVDRLIFAGRKTATSPWIRVEAFRKDPRKSFVVPVEQTGAFRDWLRVATQPTRFVSMQLGTDDEFLANHYDWNHLWNFEVIVEADSHLPLDAAYQPPLDALYVAPRPGVPPAPSKYVVSHRIFRPTREIEQIYVNKEYREIPNYAWRAKNDPKYALK